MRAAFSLIVSGKNHRYKSIRYTAHVVVAIKMLPGSPTPFQVGLDIIADVVTTVAYFAIPIELIFFSRNYHAYIPKKYKPLVLMFALFIVLCG